MLTRAFILLNWLLGRSPGTGTRIAIIRATPDVAAPAQRRTNVSEPSVASRSRARVVRHGRASRVGRPNHAERAFLLFAMLAVVVGSREVRAQDLTHKAAPQKTTIVIINAAIYPVSHEPIAKGYIVLEGGQIKALGEGEAPAAPAGAQVIDLKGGKRVYPGMISPYTQLGLTEIPSVVQTVDTAESARIAPEVIAANAVNPDSTLIPVTRSNGILTAGIFPTGGLISGQPSVIRLDGWTTNDMAVRHSIGQVLSWPNMRTFTAWWMNDSEEEQQKNIRRDLDAVTRVFDTSKAYRDARAGDPTSPADLRWDAMLPLFTAEAGKQRAKLFVRANSVDQLIAVASFAERYDLDVVVIGGREAALCASVLKKRNIPIIVQGTLNMPRREDEGYDEAYTLPARLHEAGLVFAMSHADDTAHERNVPYQAAMAVAHGLPNDIALKSVTLWAATVLGVDSMLGSLDPAKNATLIITNGDPLEITTSIERAFVDGREIDLSNKQTKLAEKYRERYRQQKEAR